MARLTRERDEALEREQAIAEVLRAISSSPGELDPVFRVILESAMRICEANFGGIFQVKDGDTRLLAEIGLPLDFATFLQRERPRATPQHPHNRVIATRRTLHIIDYRQDQAYLERDPMAVGGVEIGGIRTLLTVPMLRDDALVGVMATFRQEVRPFTHEQIELLQSFAAQAVIAIENARLLNELKQRTEDLSESLDWQTATSDILGSIAASPGDAEGALRKIAETTVRLFAAAGASFRIADGDAFRLSVGVGLGAEQISSRLYADPATRPTVGSRTLPGTVVRENRQIHLPDLDNLDDEFADWPGPPLARRAGIRTMVGTPLRAGGRALGALIVYRDMLQPFEPAELQLLQSFADQAVIALENARLLGELRESLDQQTATAEVLKVISSSSGELDPVFKAMLENAVRICAASFGLMMLREDDAFRRVALHNASQDYEAFAEKTPLLYVSKHPSLGHIIESKAAYQIADMSKAEPEAPVVRFGHAKSLLNVPMLKEGELIGVIGIYRKEVEEFTDKQIEVVQNFAAQAVIAIENARLLSELRQRTDDLSKSLEELRSAQDRLVQTQKLASLGQLTAGIAHEIKNPLNFVNNFSGISVELIQELEEALDGANLDDKRRGEIVELTETLRGNLDKIAQHGKRADSIVKNMLLHSRDGSGEQRTIDINAMVEESLNLAYHGARAEKQGFNITLERSFDPEAGEADLYPQEISRALLNFITNGFYAATKRGAEAGNNGYEPLLAASTKSLGDRVEIRIRDNGTGIAPKVKDKMFDPFFTTKPAGEGTGLGLSISHDIIVKQHSGSIEVDSTPGEFTEIRIVLPRTAIKSGKQA